MAKKIVEGVAIDNLKTLISSYYRRRDQRRALRMLRRSIRILRKTIG